MKARRQWSDRKRPFLWTLEEERKPHEVQELTWHTMSWMSSMPIGREEGELDPGEVINLPARLDAHLTLGTLSGFVRSWLCARSVKVDELLRWAL